MPEVKSKPFGFRLSAHEQEAVTRKAGELSIGEYARRLALGAAPDPQIDGRRAVGKAIRAIHAAIRAGLPEEASRDILRLLEDALLGLRQSAESARHPPEDDDWL